MPLINHCCCLGGTKIVVLGHIKRLIKSFRRMVTLYLKQTSWKNYPFQCIYSIWEKKCITLRISISDIFIFLIPTKRLILMFVLFHSTNVKKSNRVENVLTAAGYNRNFNVFVGIGKTKQYALFLARKTSFFHNGNHQIKLIF